jgi:hypothetical protein
VQQKSAEFAGNSTLGVAGQGIQACNTRASPQAWRRRWW